MSTSEGSTPRDSTLPRSLLRRSPPRRGPARLAMTLGLTRLLEALVRNPALLVLNYHRIGDGESSPYDPQLFTATRNELEGHLDCLTRLYRLIGLDEAIAFAEGAHDLSGPSLLLTFDDGYRDNYDTAFPILSRRGAKATFFLTSSWIGSTRVPWWDAIAYSVRHCQATEIRLGPPYSRAFPLTGENAMEVCRSCQVLYRSVGGPDPEVFVRRLEDATGVEVPEAVPSLFLDWDQAREMVRAGMSIGSHTHTHRILGKLGTAEQEAELRHSRALLEDRLQSTIESLGYPIGERKSIAAETPAIVRKAGYRAAFSYYGGVNLPDGVDPYNVLRETLNHKVPAKILRARVALAFFRARRAAQRSPA